MSTLNELALPCLDTDLKKAHEAGEIALSVAMQIQTVRLLADLLAVAVETHERTAKGKKR